MSKAAVILSFLLNIAFLGAIGAAAFLREADSTFVAEYFLEKNQAEREFLREGDLPKWVAAARADGAEITEDFKAKIIAYAKDEEEVKTILALIDKDASVGVQRLLSESARQQRIALARRLQETEASVERSRMLVSEFPDFIENMKKEHEDLKNREKDFEVRKERVEALAKDDALNQIIVSIDEAKKPKDAVSWLNNLSVDKQWYIISRLADPNTRTAIMNALSEEDQAAIKSFMTNPYGGDPATAEVGTPSGG